MNSSNGPLLDVIADPAPQRRWKLTAAQRSIWTAQRMWPDVSFAIALYLDIGGAVNLDRLSAAAAAANARCGLMSVRLGVFHGEPYWVADATLPRQVECLDLRDSDSPFDDAQAWMADEYRTPIDVAVTGLLKLTLLRISDNRSFFYVRCHHAVLDGFGARNLIEEVLETYSRTSDIGVPEVVDYSGFDELLRSEAAYDVSQRWERDAEYWNSVLSASPDVLGIKQAQRESPQHPQVSRLLVPRTAAANCDDAPGTRSTAAAAIAAVAVFLHHITGHDDIRLSIPVSVRTTARLKSTAGMVSNLLPLSVAFNADDTVADLVRRTGESLSGALRHQHFRDWAAVARGSAGRAIVADFGPTVNILDFFAPVTVGSSKATTNVLTTGPIRDLAVNVYSRLAGDGLDVEFTWNPDRYDGARMEHYAAVLGRILSRFVFGDPAVVIGDVDLLDPTERDALASSGHGEVRPLAGVSLVEVFDAVVAATPDAVALICGHEQLTYR
ncbi:condensation domain-containing protein, partial [Gordonia sp. NPDC058843]|uniref:condensation domain-containing protein n=1 Tax=Gordonia sp. NPDC058843 TaxID=3346648 RepID=UPI003696AF7A